MNRKKILGYTVVGFRELVCNACLVYILIGGGYRCFVDRPDNCYFRVRFIPRKIHRLQPVNLTPVFHGEPQSGVVNPYIFKSLAYTAFDGTIFIGVPEFRFCRVVVNFDFFHQP